MEQYIEQVIAEGGVAEELILERVAQDGEGPIETGVVAMKAGPVVGGEDCAEIGAVDDGVVADDGLVVEDERVVEGASVDEDGQGGDEDGVVAKR